MLSSLRREVCVCVRVALARRELAHAAGDAAAVCGRKGGVRAREREKQSETEQTTDGAAAERRSLARPPVFGRLRDPTPKQSLAWCA